jgi:hypothetical protein
MITGMESHAADVSLAHDEVRPRLVTVRKDQTAVIAEAGPEVQALLG